MKIQWIIMLLLFCVGSTFAQDATINQARLVYRALEGEKYDELSKLTSTETREVLNAPVFRQIRAVIAKQGEPENTYTNTDLKATDSITALALEMIKNMNAENNKNSGKKPGSLVIGEFSMVPAEDMNMVKAEIPKTGLNLIMGFDKKDKLVQCYLEPISAPAAVKIEQDPAYANSNLYQEKQIFVRTGAFILPGTLTIPKGKQNFPIVVFVHGSGPGNRDESIFALRPFRDIALGLAANGIATLRYDKRTRVYPRVPAPDGEVITIQAETTDDAASAIRLAEAVPGVNKNSIYVIGHSLGGMMTPQILKENSILAGGILLSGPSRSYQASVESQIQQGIGMDKSYMETKLFEIDMIKHVDTIADQTKVLMAQTVGFWKSLLDYNQLDVVKKIKQPILILQGERDHQVPFSDLDLWKEAVKDKKNATTKSYPKLNHFYTEGEGPVTFNEYYKHRNVPLYVIEDIVGWILKNNLNQR